MDNFFLKLFMALAIVYMAICFITSVVNNDTNGTIIFGMSLVGLVMTLFLYYTFIETDIYSKKQ